MEKPTEHYADCYHCRHKFDAMKADWCECLSSQRSLVCPECNRCFCDAELSYRQSFWFSAPQALWRRKAEAKKLNERSNPRPGEVRRPLVLVVDDDAQILSVAVAVTERLGYGVIVANDGVEALELAQMYRPNLILTDVLMPRLGGRELCRRIKQDHTLGETPVVVMSSVYRDSGFRDETVASFDADEYLVKPLQPAALGALLREHLPPRSEVL